MRSCKNSPKLLRPHFKLLFLVPEEVQESLSLSSRTGNPLTQFQLSHSNNHKTSSRPITGSFQGRSRSSRRSVWGEALIPELWLWIKSIMWMLQISNVRSETRDVSRDSHRGRTDGLIGNLQTDGQTEDRTESEFPSLKFYFFKSSVNQLVLINSKQLSLL